MHGPVSVLALTRLSPLHRCSPCLLRRRLLLLHPQRVDTRPILHSQRVYARPLPLSQSTPPAAFSTILTMLPPASSNLNACLHAFSALNVSMPTLSALNSLRSRPLHPQCVNARSLRLSAYPLCVSACPFCVSARHLRSPQHAPMQLSTRSTHSAHPSRPPVLRRRHQAPGQCPLQAPETRRLSPQVRA